MGGWEEEEMVVVERWSGVWSRGQGNWFVTHAITNQLTNVAICIETWVEYEMREGMWYK